mgnify:CR=1 FL=1
MNRRLPWRWWRLSPVQAYAGAASSFSAVVLLGAWITIGGLLLWQWRETVAAELRQRNFPLVVDPVSVSQSGSRLLQEDAVAALIDEMLPGCDLLTPNRPEAEMLTGMSIASLDDAAEAGEKLLAMGARAVLIKGGHMESSIMVTDCLCVPGEAPKHLPQAKVETANNHGTGCTLSAAIATGLGRGLPLQVAVSRAQEYLNLALRKSYAPGKGCGPVNHAADLNIK